MIDHDGARHAMEEILEDLKKVARGLKRMPARVDDWKTVHHLFLRLSRIGVGVSSVAAEFKPSAILGLMETLDRFEDALKTDDQTKEDKLKGLIKTILDRLTDGEESDNPQTEGAFKDFIKFLDKHGDHLGIEVKCMRVDRVTGEVEEVDRETRDEVIERDASGVIH